MRVLLAFFISALFNSFSFSQTIFYQDIYNGGVTGGGGSPPHIGGISNFLINISSGSSIRKAYLFAGRHGNANSITVTLNNIPFKFDSTNQITSTFQSPLYGGNSAVHALELTTFINPITLNYELNVPTQPSSFSSGGYGNRFHDFYLYVAYENPALTKVNATIALNATDLGFPNYLLNPINPVNSVMPIGIALFTGYLCDTINDGELVSINGNNIGLIGGNDINSGYCGGPIGSFYYENNALFGLSDDTANGTMCGSDALCNAQGYITNNSASVDIKFLNNNNSNAIWGIFLTYESPCANFNPTVSSNTQICRSDSVPLNATGGIKYEWLPQKGLSCYDCASPLASPDSSTNYTVRIWNTDSCSKVLPVRVIVNQLPQPGNIATTLSECGNNNGSITVNITGGLSPYIYNIGNGNTSSNTFNNLIADTYTLKITDANNCTYTAPPVTVAEVNNVVATFTATPETGIAPLTVNFNNTSTGANNFVWYINSDTLLTQNPSYIFDTAGTYPVTLIAYNNEARCADTATITIIAEEGFYAEIPNVFTPNNDGTNDLFKIKIKGAKNLSVSIYNRWGKEIIDFSTEPVLSVVEGLSMTPIAVWDGRANGGVEVSEGVYYYTLTAVALDDKEHTASGYVHLFR